MKNCTLITISEEVKRIIFNDLVNLGDVNFKMNFAEIGKPPNKLFLWLRAFVTRVLGLGFQAAIIGWIEKTFIVSTKDLK